MTFWIGSVAKKKDDSKDPTGVFKMVDKLLPEKPRLKPQDRARDIEAALDWMRNKGVKPEDDDVPMSEKLYKIESVPIFRCTPDQRMDDVDDIVTWLQNGKDDSDDSGRLGLDEE